jgi:hypothetical protein
MSNFSPTKLRAAKRARKRLDVRKKRPRNINIRLSVCIRWKMVECLGGFLTMLSKNVKLIFFLVLKQSHSEST